MPVWELVEAWVEEMRFSLCRVNTLTHLRGCVRVFTDGATSVRIVR